MRSLLRLLLTALAATLFVAGWIAGVVSRAVLWCWSAAAVGWDSATGEAAPVDAPLKRVA